MSTAESAGERSDGEGSGERSDGGRSGERSDAELIALVRGRPADPAATEAFAVLYARHREAARALARQLARSPADADDLVAGAFARLLEVMRAGKGPTEAFRAYLLTALRHSAYDRTRAERRLDLTDDLGDVVGVDPERTVVPFTDPALAGLERSLAARAFATLPERWQAVLWHLEVEGDAPADIAPLFGLSANAVSALGYRAREGLRQAYLQEHLAARPSGEDRRHRQTGEKLGAYTRGGLSRRDAARIEAHLAECEECRSLAAELREVNSGLLRSVVGPLVVGAALMGYLAGRGGSEHLAAGLGATTGELAVAGVGPLGLLGALARPGVLVGAFATVPGGAVTAAVGLAGIAAASVALGLGSSPDLGGSPGLGAGLGPEGGASMGPLPGSGIAPSHPPLARPAVPPSALPSAPPSVPPPVPPSGRPTAPSHAPPGSPPTVASASPRPPRTTLPGPEHRHHHPHHQHRHQHRHQHPPHQHAGHPHHRSHDRHSRHDHRPAIVDCPLTLPILALGPSMSPRTGEPYTRSG